VLQYCLLSATYESSSRRSTALLVLCCLLNPINFDLFITFLVSCVKVLSLNRLMPKKMIPFCFSKFFVLPSEHFKKRMLCYFKKTNGSKLVWFREQTKVCLTRLYFYSYFNCRSDYRIFYDNF
jgi:hypothetical protein